MGVSKVILNGQTLIDVTQKTVAANNLLSPNTALSAAGSDVVGEIATKSEADLVVDGAVVTVPSGYYATAASASTNAGATYTCTIIESNSSYNVASIEYNGTYYLTQGDTFTYYAGESAQLRASGRVSNAYIYVDNILVAEATGAANYVYTLPSHDIEIILYVGSYGSTKVNFPTVTITENGVHTVDSYYYADVNVYPTLQSKSNIIPTESSQIITADSSYYGLSSVQIAAIDSKYIGTGVVTKAAESYELSSSTRTIPSGTYLTGDQTILPFRYSGISGQTIKYGTVVKIGDSEDDDRMISITGGFTGANYVSTGQTAANSSQILEGYSAWVNGNEVKGNITTKAAATITPTESEQIAVAAGKYTTGAIKVAAINSNYVGSNIPQRASANLSASGSVVTASAGYYASAAQKAVTAGTATTPAKTINVTPTVSLNSSTGVVSIGITGSSNITPTVIAGYISNGTSGTVSVSGSSTFNLTSKAAASYTPSSTTQTIASGQYLTGVQTIAGDSNLVAANIASGVTIFGITGTYTGETYVAMTTQEIWEAAASGWGSTNPSVAAAIWNSVAAGWSVSATMTDSTIHTAVASGWR